MKKDMNLDIEAELENLEKSLKNIKIIAGKIKWFSIEKGIGYIFGEDENSYFFHISDIKDVRLPKLKDSVLFQPVVNEKNSNRKAIDITLINKEEKIYTEEKPTSLPEKNENLSLKSNENFIDEKDKIEINIEQPIITRYPGLENYILVEKTFLKITAVIFFGVLLSMMYFFAIEINPSQKEQKSIPIFMKDSDK